MPVVFSDSFTGADGSAWSSTNWADDITPAGGGASIQANSGVLLTGSEGNYSGNDRVAKKFAANRQDGEFTGTVWFDNTECFPMIMARASSDFTPKLNTQRGYFLAIEKNLWALGKFTNYVSADFASGVHNFAPFEKIKFRFRVVGNELKVRIWAAASPEPSIWHASVTDSSYPSAGAWGITVAGGLGAAPGNAFQQVGNSGLPWNSGTFSGNGGDAGDTTFANWRGTPTDARLFFPGRSAFSDSQIGWINEQMDDYSGIKVISLPSQPDGQSNTNTANGTNNAWWQSYGAKLVARGYNNWKTVIRLNWEFNIPSWSHRNNNPNVATFINAYRNVVTAIRAGGATNVKFNYCANKGPDQTGVAWQDSYPGDAYVDIIGLDFYDHWNKSTNDTEWNAEIARNPSLTNISQFARDRGKHISLDEWGLSHWSGGVGGGDNPFFITKTWDWLVANADVVAYETYYNDPGNPADLLHQLSDGTNPNGGAAYRHATRWGGGN